MSDFVSLHELELSDEEFDLVSSVLARGFVPDEPFLRREDPWEYLVRIGVLRHDYCPDLPTRELIGVTLPRNALCLSDRGRCLLVREQRRRQEQAQEKRERKRGRRFDLFLLALGAVLGELVQLLVKGLPALLQAVRALFA